MRPGEVIGGRYWVERVLGDGAHGVVVGAVDVRGGGRVAIKMLHATTEAEPTLVARFLREGDAASRLRSAHVAQVIDAGTGDDGRPYLVTELLEGEDLARAIASRDVFDIGEAVDLVLQTCSGLAEAHAAGIIHRDLKPANLFLTRAEDGSPLVKILDFGVCKVASADVLTMPAELIGTPRYMSPEQLAGRAVDRRADIWALGVVLYELLTKQSPFEGERLSAIMHAVLTTEARPLHELRRGVPSGLSRVALRCLTKKPQDRYTTVEELAAALAPFALSRPRRPAALAPFALSRPRRSADDAPAPETETTHGAKGARGSTPRVDPTLASPGLGSNRSPADSVTNELAIATPKKESSPEVTLVSASDEPAGAPAAAPAPRESSPSAREPPVMQRFGKYVLYAPLARGGMASVYYGVKEEDDGSLRPVALKRVRAELTDANFAAMLADEARIAGRVRHPNVVATLDIIVSEGESMLALEYVPGVSLGELMRALRSRGVKFPPAIASAIVVHVLAGLHAAHEAVDLTGQPLDIVHRDVSPANVLLDEHGGAKVADFGVAYARGRLQKTTETGAMKGKLTYLSPEQVHGEATRVSDIYAVGVVLWEMLAGRPVFSGSEGEVLAAVLLGKIKPPSTVGRPEVAPIDGVVMTALANDAKRRYPTALAMSEALAGAAPPAPLAEVAAFVDAHVGDAIAARRREVRAMLDAVRHSDIFAEGAPLTMPLGEGPPPFAPPLATPRSSSRLIERTPAGVQAPSIVAMLPIAAPGKATPRLSALLGAGVAVLFLGGAVVVWTMMRPPVTTPTSPIASPPAAITLVPSSAPSALEVDEVPTEEPTLDAGGPGSPSASADHRSTRPSGTRKTTKACSPPYTINEDGRTIWKRECFRK